MKTGSSSHFLARGLLTLCLLLPLANVVALAQPAYADYYKTSYENVRTGNRINFRPSGDQVCFEEEVHLMWYKWLVEEDGNEILLESELLRSEWLTFCEDNPYHQNWTSVDNYTFSYYTPWDEWCRCYAAVYSVSTDWYLDGVYDHTDCCSEYYDWYYD